MGSLFSSPGKQASAAASASGQLADQEITKLLGYTDTHQQELRDAIGKQGPNPYFAAAQQLNPQAYYMNPQDTATFSAGGPGSGLTPGNSAVQGNPFAPPPPRVILNPTTGGPPSSPPTSPGGGSPPSNPNPTPQPPGRIPPRDPQMPMPNPFIPIRERA